MDEAVQVYIDAIQPAQRPLFDRVHRLILATYPDVTVLMSYKMPTYDVDGRRLHVGAWKHGVSFYGWAEERDGGFTARHPELSSGKGTMRLRPADADAIADDELLDVIRAALDA